jgi:hypothetical protein
VLRTAGGVALVATGWAVAGCDASPSSQPSPAPGSLRASDPVTEAQRRAAIADEHALIAAYQATETRHPALHAILAIPLAHHAAHLKALDVPASARSSASPSSTAVTSPPVAPVPSDAGLALRSLAAQEQAVARRRRAACADASGKWAGLLGSLGACEAGHAALLGAT